MNPANGKFCALLALLLVSATLAVFWPRNLGTMLARRGEFAVAVTEYQLALAHGLDTPEVRDNLMRAQAALK